MTKLFTAVVVLAAFIEQAPNKGRPDTVHVSSVDRKQQNDETGATIENHVIADSKTIRYVLTCTDMFPSKKTPILCTHVEAGKDYEVHVYPTAIDFGGSDGTKYRLVYDIESQVEK